MNCLGLLEIRRRRSLVRSLKRFSLVLVAFSTFVASASFGTGEIYADSPAPSQENSVEVFDDLNFEKGFRVVDGAKKLGFLRFPPRNNDASPDADAPVWVLAQHNSKYNLTKGAIQLDGSGSVACLTPGQRVALERDERGELSLRLDVATNNEYATPRKLNEPWIHLLLVRDLPEDKRVRLCETKSLVFSCDARVNYWKRLMGPDEFDSNIHATQASFYFVIGNYNPESPDYQDYIWFGISFFDDRYKVQTQYVELDGDPRVIGTGKLIYRLGDQKTIDDLMNGVNPYSLSWTHVEIDIMKYANDMLEAAQRRGIMTSTTLDDLQLVHFNFGWETPGVYEASISLKNVHLRATPK